jgi:transcriptional regulator with XRE-family HTH domain
MAECHPVDQVDDSGANLAANVRRLREARGLSQARIARLAGIPRPTWASLEAGSANPTLGVLTRTAAALSVSIEELIGPPRTAARLFTAGGWPERRRQGARIRPLVPESIPGLEIVRMELAPGGQLAGIPHTPGTREYLTCEAGRIELAASGERWQLAPGDALVFRGDQRHGYRNLDARRPAVAISVVCFAATAGCGG